MLRNLRKKSEKIKKTSILFSKNSKAAHFDVKSDKSRKIRLSEPMRFNSAAADKKQTDKAYAHSDNLACRYRFVIKKCAGCDKGNSQKTALHD